MKKRKYGLCSMMAMGLTGGTLWGDDLLNPPKLTYQGEVRYFGGLITGTVDFEFSLWDDSGTGCPPVGGIQIGTTQSRTMFISAGVFFVNDLDFGTDAFNGRRRYMQIAIRFPSGGPDPFVTLCPRIELTPTPYAMALPAIRNTPGSAPFESSPNTISGHHGNTVGAGVVGATIGGGGADGLFVNSVTGLWATIGGGRRNLASGNNSTIGGGTTNSATEIKSTVGGGLSNTASGPESTVGGGGGNTASQLNATVGGGGSNMASGVESTVGGGRNNRALNLNSTVGGGVSNSAEGDWSTIGGGTANSASGNGSTVTGGLNNAATGLGSTVSGHSNRADGDHSFAAGIRAKAIHQGAFVWADDTGADWTSTGTNQFLIRATGGVGIGSTSPLGLMELQGGADNDGTDAGPLSLAWRNGGFRHFIRTRHHDDLSIANTNAIEFYVNNSTLQSGSTEPGTGNIEVMELSGGIGGVPRVGIGRSPVTNQLEVAGDASKDTAGDWLANSDARIKTDVQTVSHALETLDKVRLVEFRYTDHYRAAHPTITDQPYLNIIAQEFGEVFPRHVKPGGDTLPDGSKVLQADTYPLTIYSAAAVQELHQMVQEKDCRITELEVKVKTIEELESKLASLEALVTKLAARAQTEKEVAP